MMEERIIDCIFLFLVGFSSMGIGFILGQKVFLPSNLEFVKIAGLVAENYTYTDDFNCINFSKALVRELQNAGYEARVVYGTWSNGKTKDYHAWVIVEIPIESTIGEIITPAEYEKAYKVID